MTKENQIKVLAELDGWVPHSPGDFNPTPRWERKLMSGKVVQISLLPNYITSYDAIIPLIQKQAVDVRYTVGTQHRAWNFLRTPAQLCEALLRATGKWEETCS